MQQRALGQQGLVVSALGLGTMGMTMAYGPSDEQEGIATIRRAHELGVTFFDTAELYGRGTGSNEKLVGRAVAPFRDDVVIATKFGFDLAGTRPSGVDSRPEHILEVADNSLRYSPLGRGFLTAAVKSPDEYASDDMRRVRDPRWQGENFAKNRAPLTQLETLAADKGIALSQLALAWLLAQGGDIVPIPGTRNASRLEENVGAVDVTLSADDLRRIRDVFPDGAYGPRYAEASLPAWV
jgi:aryl-alcohol dehydrogenase-like predicted oxidoreductase